MELRSFIVVIHRKKVDVAHNGDTRASYDDPRGRQEHIPWYNAVIGDSALQSDMMSTAISTRHFHSIFK